MTKVVLSGGGTGGHIYPALALKKIYEHAHPQSEFLYIGTANGLESQIVPQAGIDFKTIDIQGFKRSLSWTNALTLYKFLKSVRQARAMLKEFEADVVVGTGGFVCGPVLYAASRLNIPTIIHEQNSLPGLTNSFLSRFVDRIALSFEEAAPYFKGQKDKLVYTGNPRAQEIASVKNAKGLETYGLYSDRPTLLIFGGSRGADRINDLVIQSFEYFDQADYQVLFACGSAYYQQVEEARGIIPQSKTFKTVPYISNMPEVLANISMVVCRSGATTLAEITALGIPALLIPSPNVTNDHQSKNARALEKNGAAKMISERELTQEQFLYDIEQMMKNKDLRESMAVASFQMGVQDAGDRLVGVIEELLDQKEGA